MYIYFYFYEDDLLYIGSTKDMKNREKVHRKEFKRDNPMKIYQFLRENGMTLDDLEKEVVKTELTCRNELYVLEHDLIKMYEPLYNERTSYTPGRTKKEYDKDWYQDNKEYAKEYKKEWDEANRDKIKEYYKANRDQILQKQKIRRYYQENKEYIKNYHHKNRDKINQRRRELYTEKKRLKEQNL